MTLTSFCNIFRFVVFTYLFQSFTCPFCSNGFIEEVSEQTELDGDGSDGDEFGVSIEYLIYSDDIYRIARILGSYQRYTYAGDGTFHRNSGR